MPVQLAYKQTPWGVGGNVFLSVGIMATAKLDKLSRQLTAEAKTVSAKKSQVRHVSIHLSVSILPSNLQDLMIEQQRSAEKGNY